MRATGDALMPRLVPARRRLDPLPSVLCNFHAWRLALGWLVAREAGIAAPLDPLVSDAVLAQWDRTRNLPKPLKELQPAARLIYRVRNLTLILNGDRRAELCGGTELWWQNILNEQLLGMLIAQLMPSLIPGLKGIPPKQRAGCEWWMRRGVNPCNPAMEPATWALVEAAQERVFPSRGVCDSPGTFDPLPLAALNGQMSLPRRRKLLAQMTAGANGYSPRSSSEFHSDWTSMLKAWVLSDASLAPTRQPSPKVRDAGLYEQAAFAVHDVLLPSVFESVQAIKGALELNTDK